MSNLDVNRIRNVAAIANGVHSNDVHQAVLVLFNYDNTNKISSLSVAANWYSGHGTPPPPVGQEYPRSNYEKLFQGTGVTFIEDIMNNGKVIYAR